MTYQKDCSTLSTDLYMGMRNDSKIEQEERWIIVFNLLFQKDEKKIERF